MSDEAKTQAPAPTGRAKVASVKKRGRSHNMADLSATAAPGDDPVVGRDIQSHLGRTLKASYEDMVRQPVPDKFHQLLKELERREKN
jgi:hypothetical protein